MPVKEGNRFFQPTSAQYTSQFVEEESLFPQMIGLAERDLQKRDLALGELGQMTQYLNINADPHQEQFRQEKLQEYYGRIGELQKRLSEGENPDVIMGSLTSINRDWQMDERRGSLERGFLQGQAHQVDKRKAVGDKTYRPYGDSFLEQLKSNEAGQFSELSYEGISPFVNPQESALAAVGTIRPDSFEKGTFHRDKDGNVISIVSGKEGVVAEKLLDISRATARSWAKSTPGISYKEELIYQTKGLEEGLQSEDPAVQEKANKFIEDSMTSYLAGLGANQVALSEKDIERFQYAPERIGGAGPNDDFKQDYDQPWMDEVSYNNILEKGDLKQYPGTDTPGAYANPIWTGSDKFTENKTHYYKDLKYEEKEMYERIADHFNPNADTDTETFKKGWYDSDKAHQLVADYIADLKGKKISHRPVLDQTNYKYVDTHGMTQVDYTDAEEDIKTNSMGMLFYDVENDRVISSDKTPVRYKNLAEKLGVDDFEFMGDWDYKNHVTLKTDTEGFANAYAIKTRTDNGKEKLYWVTKTAYDQKSPEGLSRKYWNKMYNETKLLPNIPSDHTYTDNTGTDRKFDVTWTPETESWHVKSKDKYNGQYIQFTSTELGDIDQQIVNYASIIYSGNE